MVPAPQSFENRDGAIGIQTEGGEIQPEAPRGGGFGGTWPGEGGGEGSRVPVASAGGDCAAGPWFGGMQSGRAVSALYAARFAALSRDPRGAAGTFLSRRIAAGKEKYPEKKPGTLIFLSGAAFKFTKAAVRKPGPRLFFPHLKRRRERKAAQKKGLGSRRRGGVQRTGGGPARAAERRAGRSGQRSLRGVNFATARSARSGYGTRGRPWGQQTAKAPPYSTNSTNPTPKIHPQNLSHADKRKLFSSVPD